MMIDRKSPALARVLVPVATCALIVLGCANLKNESSQPPESKSQTSPSPSPELPPGYPKPKISGHIPLAIPEIPPTVKTPENARPYFDHFSWESFIALNWPAATGRRGAPDRPDTPDVFRKARNGTPVVWGTYKEAFELFSQRKNRPSAWESYDVAIGPCEDAGAREKTFVMVTKGGTLLDEINEAFSYPLIDQDSNYVYNEVRFNRSQYRFIRGVDSDPGSWLYLLKNLAREQPIHMPSSSPPDTRGSIMLKAAWREMTDNDDRDRYYVVNAHLLDPLSKTCVERPMGLVGFHIVQKLKAFPQWIWSTFEQVDNVPGSGPGPFSFNNGKDIPETRRGWANKPTKRAPDLRPRWERRPVQVTRLNKIPDTPEGASTQDINRLYRNILKGTVWENYQLVITQWPSDPGTFTSMVDGGIYPQDCGAAFPARGATNTVMETYFQSQRDAKGAGGNSCMSCHYRAADADFSWVLKGRAHR